MIVHNPELDIVKSVPSPSIFSPSSPNTSPMLLGKFTSAFAVKLMSPLAAVIVKLVPFDSIFSLASAKCNPMLIGITTSVPADKFSKLLEVIGVYLLLPLN